MQKRHQDLVKNQEEELYHSQSLVPKKRPRMLFNTANDTNMTLSPTYIGERILDPLRRSPTSSPKYVGSNKKMECEPDTKETNNTEDPVSKPETSSSICVDHVNDEMNKRSAFREVSRSRPDNNADNLHQSHLTRESIILQSNKQLFQQRLPMYPAADYSYLRNSYLPVVIPRGDVSYSSLEVARWQQAVSAAQYNSYYQHYWPKVISDLEPETKRYTERLIARGRSPAEGLPLRCNVDNSTLSFSPRVHGPRTSPNTNIGAYPRSEDVFVGMKPENSELPWQRPVLSGSVHPLSSSMVDLPTENWCAKCNASFRMTSDLVYHMRTHHKRNQGSDLGKRREDKLKCNICNETFRERHHLTRHMTSHVNG